MLGVWTGKTARAYPVEVLAKRGLVVDEIDGEPLVAVWEPATRTAAAYRPVAVQPRKFRAPEPDKTGVSKPDPGEPTPAEAPVAPPRKLTFTATGPGRLQDTETRSLWDVAGRCVAGELKGYTLEWVDGVQVRWFAWAAEYPATSVYAAPPTPPTAAEANKAVKEVAGTAEFLRLLPKPFATVKGVDAKARAVTLLADGETAERTWPVEPDAEVKGGGWGGRVRSSPQRPAWARSHFPASA